MSEWPDYADTAITRLPDKALTSTERLAQVTVLIKEKYGPDYDPLLRLLELGEEAALDGDKKTAITALSAVTDRLYPKLKATEITNDSAQVIIIDAQSAAATRRANAKRLVS